MSFTAQEILKQIQSAKIEVVGVHELMPYARNAMVHPEWQIAEIAASIKEFGFTQAVLIDPEGTIVAGHGRVLAALKLGLEVVPCRRLGYLTEAQRRAYALVDNKIPRGATWDVEMVKLELGELKLEGIDLSIAGLDKWDLPGLSWGAGGSEGTGGTDGKTDADSVPEPPKVATSKLGQLWILGRHRLLCGDSTDGSAMKRLMAGESAAIVFTDPPYGVKYKDRAGRSIKNDDLVGGELERFLLTAFTLARSASSEDAPWFVWHPDRYAMEFMHAMHKAGLTLRQQIIWVKGPGVEDSARVAMGAAGFSHWRCLHEPCWYASAGKPFNAGDRSTTTVWTVTRELGGYVHPTQKPVKLAELALTNASKPDALVLDPFLGSGSTLIGAEKTGRRCFGLELDPIHCDTIVKRWEEFTGQKAVLANEGA